MTAAEIAAALGDARREGRGWRCLCPVHGGNSLVIADGRDRLLLKCWGGGCDARDIFAALRCLGLIGGDPRVDRSPPANGHTDRGRGLQIEIARRIWDRAVDPRSTPVEHYLRERGIALALPPSLRYASALRRLDGTYGPAMVARIDSIDAEMIGIARTWLARDAAGRWCRLGRAMLGRASGGAVRLPGAAEMLLVGEGVETCLAVLQATSMPVWAALSTSGMTALLLPASVRTVIILADHDHNGAGERAARAAAQRWLAEGRRVRIAMPPQAGMDMADVLAGRSHARLVEACNVAA